MKNKDKSRKWMWWFLGVVAALQVYFVRELLAAFALQSSARQTAGTQRWLPLGKA